MTTGAEVQFTKEVIEKGDDQYRHFVKETAEQTTDIIGKHLYEFRQFSGASVDKEDVPEIFVLLVSYFEVYPELLKTDGIFRVAASQDKIEELQIHISTGNYSYITELEKDPHVVANFLKKVLKYMGEPLCTYDLYGRFRDVSDAGQEEEKVKRLKEICSLLPTINKNVFIFIIKFFRKVIEQSSLNRMNLHNLATVITPNLFRPFELTANDLIFAGHLVETFKLMINRYREIFGLVA
jgi:hypothetical protein